MLRTQNFCSLLMITILNVEKKSFTQIRIIHQTLTQFQVRTPKGNDKKMSHFNLLNSSYFPCCSHLNYIIRSSSSLTVKFTFTFVLKKIEMQREKSGRMKLFFPFSSSTPQHHVVFVAVVEMWENIKFHSSTALKPLIIFLLFYCNESATLIFSRFICSPYLRH